MDRTKVMTLVSEFDHAQKSFLTAIQEGLSRMQILLLVKPEFQRSLSSGCLH